MELERRVLGSGRGGGGVEREEVVRRLVPCIHTHALSELGNARPKRHGSAARKTELMRPSIARGRPCDFVRTLDAHNSSTSVDQSHRLAAGRAILLGWERLPEQLILPQNARGAVESTRARACKASRTPLSVSLSSLNSLFADATASPPLPAAS